MILPQPENCRKTDGKIPKRINIKPWKKGYFCTRSEVSLPMKKCQNNKPNGIQIITKKIIKREIEKGLK
jgi:hypothetical protein